MSSTDTIYILANSATQATDIFVAYQTVGDEAAIVMVRTGMISPTEGEAREHKARAGQGRIFAFSITECM